MGRSWPNRGALGQGEEGIGTRTGADVDAEVKCRCLVAKVVHGMGKVKRGERTSAP